MYWRTLEFWEHLILCGRYFYVFALLTFNIVQRKKKKKAEL